MIARDQGFTLLEVLLAITVLGVVVAMLSISLSGTLRVVDATERQAEVYHQAQTTLRRITEDLSAALGTKEMGFVGKKSEQSGQRADTLVFVSLAHLVLNPEQQKPGAAVIRYQLQIDAEDTRKLRLLRSDDLLLPGVDAGKEAASGSGFLLADNLRSVRFGYLDRQGQEIDSWGDALGASEPQAVQPLPAGVHCTLEFWLDPDKETAQTFSTSVLIPAGVVVAKGKDEN